MPLPALQKTWEHSGQITLADLGTLLANNRQLLRRIKDELIDVGLTSPWIVRGSSDSVAGGMDNVDRWDSDADLVWAAAEGVTHSWIVLEQGGIATNYQILINLVVTAAATGVELDLWVSPSGAFTGGDHENRPSAPDEAKLYENVVWTYATNNAALTLATAVSTDGQCSRVIVFKGAVAAAVWILDKPQGSPAFWTPPFVALISGTSGGDFDAVTYATANAAALARLKASSVAPGASVFFASAGQSAPLGSAVNLANEISSEWPLVPIGLVSETNFGRGRYGYLADAWLGAITPVTGDVYPSGASRTLIHAGDLVLPWDGTAPPTGGTDRDGYEAAAGLSDVQQAGAHNYGVVAAHDEPLGTHGPLAVFRNQPI